MPHSEKLQKPWALYENKEYRRAFEETLPLLTQLAGSDLRDAERLLGMACLRQRLYPDAVHYLQRLCQNNDDSDTWLHLATAAVGQGNLKLAQEAFEQVRLIQRVARYGQGLGFYHQLDAYASALCDAKEHDRVLPLLDELATAYRRVGGSDASLLYVVGLPFLSSFLYLAVRHFHSAGRHAEGVAWLREFTSALDVDGQGRVARAMRDLQDMGGLSEH